MKRGFTLIELLIVLTLMSIIAILVLPPFMDFRSRQLLDSQSDLLSAVLYQARSHTLASKNNLVYGVRVETDRITIFTGESFVMGAESNEVINLDPAVTLANISLNPDPNDIIFEHLTGEALSTGSLRLELANDNTQFKMININQNGIIEVE